MRTATLVARWIVRIAGIVQLVLGVLFWTGHALGLIPLHMATGVLVVLGLWTLAILALVARVRPGLAAFAILWGIALPAFGMAQMGILPGPWHWVIRTIHLVMGLAALGTADALATHVLGSRRATGTSPG
jgi:hypothetical protein